METKAFCLDPLDTLFFRGGKPFGAADRVASGLPKPQTLAGALRTWMLRKTGCNFDKLGENITGGKSFRESLEEAVSTDLAPIADIRFRGPWLCRNGQPLIPIPPTLLKVEDSEEIIRLDPLKSTSLPGWKPDDGMLALWRKDNRPAKRAEGFLSLEGLKKYLDGGAPSKQNIVPAGDLYEIDTRTGIGVDPDALSAAEGQIYAAGMLALKKDVSLYAEISGPDSVKEWLPAEGDVLPFGGEGRRVAARPVGGVKWPSSDTAGDNQGAMLVLLTPGLFNGWEPSSLKDNLVSAAVAGYEAVSGWDMAKGGPKPNRFAVNAGSVYFVNEWEKESAGSLCDGEDAALGYGIYVQGRFDYV